MNYEKIILEMLGRIKDLEEKVVNLEEFKEKVENSFDDDEETNTITDEQVAKRNDISGRNKSRQEITNILTEKYGFSVRKASRSEGSGLLASKNGKSFGIKVSYSRSYFEYLNEDLQCCGWHAVTKKDFDNINVAFYIFVVEGTNGEYHYFIFSRDELYNYCFKNDDSQKKVHMYFRVSRDDKPYDARDGITDMSAHYNNWSIIAG